MATNLNYLVNIQYEKNKYFGFFKKNDAIYNVLSEVGRIESINRYAISHFFTGWFLGYIYFNFVMIYIIKTLVFMSTNNFSLFYFDIDPYVGINGKLIDAAYFNLTIFLLAIFWYIIYKHVKLNVIPGQSVSRKSKGLLYTLCILAGAIFISIFLIFIYIIKSIIPEFIFSELTYDLFFLVPFFIGGFLVSYFCIKLSYSKVINAKKTAENNISEFYKKGYPYVTISTSSKKIEGKIITVHDKNVIILEEDPNKTVAIPWINIIFIEVLDY